MQSLMDDPYVAAFPETAPFWTAAAQGRLLLPACLSCGRLHWHPRAFCPHCHGTRLEWRPSAGHGHVHAFSIVRRPDAPYAFGYVKLGEGLILMTNIVDCPVGDVSIGMPVGVRFRSTPQGRFAPFFAPLSTGQSTALSTPLATPAGDDEFQPPMETSQ